MMAGFDLHDFCTRCRDKKKGKDPCVEKPGSDCQHCNALTPEQLVQLSTPSYKLKKEKRDKADTTPSKNAPTTKVTLSPTLVDPARVSVIRAVDGQDTGLSAQPAEKKKKVEDKKKSKSSASASRPAAVSTDQRFNDLDQKWSDRFNRLEALLLARSLDQPQQDPTFGTVKVVPAHSPPASVIRSEPFIRPTDRPASQPVDRPSGSSDRPSTSTTTDPPTSRSQADRQHISDRPATSDRPDRPSTSISNAFQPTRKISSSESDLDGVVSDRPPVDIFVEEGELSDELDATVTDPDQSPSEEQSYRETIRGIRSFMGWTHIPDMDTTTGSSEDNPFAGPRLQTPGKISVQLPTDEWLCRKLSKLNLTLTDGYPSRSAEASGLQRDQFLKPLRSQAKWYGCHPQQKSDTTETLMSWSTDSSKLNSGYLRIARQAGIATSPPQSRPISQDTLRKWEKSARESSVICNQAAGFNRCLMKVQQDMQSQLKVIRLEHKGKSSSKLSTATEELQFLMDFNSSICQAMAKSMEHLTDSVFVNMANVTLLRRDPYLAYLKAGIKVDTLAALRTAPLHISTLFPDTVLKQAEEDISNADKGRSGSVYKKNRYHPYERQDNKSDNRRQDRPAWKNISSGHIKRNKGKHQFSSRPAKGQQPCK